MRALSGKAILIPLICSLAFGIAYTTARQASGEGDTGDSPSVVWTVEPTPATSEVPGDVPTATPDSTVEDGAPTAVPGLPSVEEMGRRVAGGESLDVAGVRLHMPAGFGDYVVIYPVLLDGPTDPALADENNIIATIYNIETESSLFVSLADRSGHARAQEVGRHVVGADGNASLDSIAANAEVLAR